MRRILVILLIGLFATAFGVHPFVHSDDDGHACLLTLPGQDAPHSAPAVGRPSPVFVGHLSVSTFIGHRSSPTAERLSRAPPLPL